MSVKIHNISIISVKMQVKSLSFFFLIKREKKKSCFTCVHVAFSQEAGEPPLVIFLCWIMQGK